jgi:lysyl-tRNA synthetase class 2
LNQQKFIEVETPVLQAIYGGTLAKPFMTHLNDLDMDVYLRIAPELFLKRVLVSGYPKIFEIARCFRNESIDREHNPEFTLLELYQAFANKEDLMKLMENLFVKLVNDNNIEIFKDISLPFERISIIDFIKQKSELDYFDNNLDEFANYLKKNKIEIEKGMSKAKMFDAIFKKFRPEIKGPAFVIDHPIDLSPLAKAKDNDERLASRFQLLVNGLELCNG